MFQSTGWECTCFRLGVGWAGGVGVGFDATSGLLVVCPVVGFFMVIAPGNAYKRGRAIVDRKWED